MNQSPFKAIVINKDTEEDGTTGAKSYRAGIQMLEHSSLPEGDVVVKISHSTINYKDALAITGKGPVVRQFPMVPGIDFVGEVIESQHATIAMGQHVILNGWGVGEAHWGGLSERARVKGDWLIPLPDSITPLQAMAIGTAGYTAMLSVIALERQGVTPDKGSILVTGANGGVGSFAIGILSKLGYPVIASTGRPEESAYLKKLGATEIIDRSTLSDAGRPLARETWAGAIDSVGSHTLTNVCAGIQYGGAVAACGLAQGMDFPATVAPFILRGISLLGIDSVMRPLSDRTEAWQRLAVDMDKGHLEDIGEVITLDDVIERSEALLKGDVRGRLIVDMQA